MLRFALGFVTGVTATCVAVTIIANFLAKDKRLDLEE